MGISNGSSIPKPSVLNSPYEKPPHPSCPAPNPDGGMNQVEITGVFLPLIFWCLKMGENGGSVRPHMVGFHTDVKTPQNHHPIPSTPHRHHLPDCPYKKPVKYKEMKC